VNALRDGRFVVLEALGEGSQGRTYDGVDKLQGKPVAIKRFDVRGAKSWKDVELAEREAKVLRALSHPKLPAYVDHFEEDGSLYLVMEKIEGESLAALRKRGGVLGEEDVLRLLRDADDVLGYLHGRAPPVIHRDLKPGNVIRRPDGSFAFVDFGAVRDKLRPEGGSTVVGTFGYMAPEQFQGRALPASDVYAIGTTAIAMLTGREPEDLPHKGLTLDVRGALGGRASERLVRALEAMLEPNPDARAPRIGPLLERIDAPPSAPRPRREGWDGPVREVIDSDGVTDVARTGGRVDGPPPVIASLVALTLTIAMVGVRIATHAVLPVLLGFLSILFGRRAMYRAAMTIRAGGETVIESLEHARDRLHGHEDRGSDVKVRVVGEEVRGRVRPDEDDDENEDDEPPSERQRRL
jgi:hypothetical protein